MKPRYSIQQQSKQAGKGWWSWSVWLDGTERDLERVESVRYLLHPTFAEPEVEVRNRSRKFRLDSSGWGEFLLRAFVRMKNGKVQQLSHWLKLDEASPKETTGGGQLEEAFPQLKVFLAASVVDRPQVLALRNALIKNNVQLVGAEDAIKIGEPWFKSVSKAVGDSDVMVLVNTDATRNWVPEEVGMAMKANKPVYSVEVGSMDVKIPGLESTKSIRVKGLGDAAAMADRIVGDLRSLVLARQSKPTSLK